MWDAMPAKVDAADVGAGTGIWTRIACGPRPAFRRRGGAQRRHARARNRNLRGTDIVWQQRFGRSHRVADGSADLVSMASSFHWADFDKACDEFHRILRPNGVFVALWNPRFIEANPLLVEIEAQITD